MSEGSTRDSQTDPNSDMPDFVAFSIIKKKMSADSGSAEVGSPAAGPSHFRWPMRWPGCLMAIFCPLSADQLTAAGPPIWSMLAVLRRYSYMYSYY
jgi:hypothetical protein